MEDQEQLLLLLKRLKEVFDVCDEGEDGFIRVEHLLELGVQFGQGEEVKKLTSYLEANASGKISFKDFCQAVLAIKGCEEILKIPVGPRSVGQPWTSNSGPENTNSEANPGPPVIVCTQAYPECSAGDSDTKSFESLKTALTDREEEFEDYGEGGDVDFTPSSPCCEDDTDVGSSLSSSAGPSPQQNHSVIHNQLDVYCSQCCKKVNLLRDLEARLRGGSSPNRKISSTAFGRQLFQSNHSGFSSTEDLIASTIDSCDLHITEKVSFLEKKVCELESDSLANSDLKSKLKQENTQLVHRVHELEEQVRDAEMKADQSLEEESRTHRETYTKTEKDRNAQINQLCNSIQQLEEENTDMRSNVCRLKSQTEKLDQEKQKMTDRLEDTSLRLKDEMDLYRKILDKLWHNRHEFQKEKESMQELVEDLRRELDYLQMFKVEMEHPGKGKGLAAKTREMEMEHEVRRLKQDNYKLRDQNDDLNAQILSLSLYDVKNLLSSHSKAQCLAAEIDNASRDEVVVALKDQEENNLRLRQYMDKIILAILDHNPSILEIKN
ncbi:rab11 family-interacting protein 4A [Gouania willdenowi]|uniref:rab11 family-interacting protein 4A n=1 Tax=Gouania willdenowi TaxID=441366 RepID=UPI0010558AD1|nr:rab11 family-interacting protein 4A-like [Gouania willdenowi]